MAEDCVVVTTIAQKSICDALSFISTTSAKFLN